MRQRCAARHRATPHFAEPRRATPALRYAALRCATLRCTVPPRNGASRYGAMPRHAAPCCAALHIILWCNNLQSSLHYLLFAMFVKYDCSGPIAYRRNQQAPKLAQLVLPTTCVDSAKAVKIDWVQLR